MPDLRVLGPVELWAAGRRFELGPRKQQTVLTALVADAGRPVPVDVVIDRVWDEAPRGVRSVVHTYVTRLRRILAQASRTDGVEIGLSYRTGSYILEVDPDLVDMHRFQRLVDEGRAPDGDDHARAEALRRALALWRADPLSGLASGWVARTAEQLAQQRLSAMLALATAELRLGHADAVVDDLLARHQEHPLMEPLAAVLMRALHAAGRRAEALACYANMRRLLVDELGTEPGPDLQESHRAILRGEPLVGAGAGSGRLAWARPGVPAPLPPAVRGFTGRLDSLAQAAVAQPPRWWS